MYFFTGDHHFFHKNIIGFVKRPFDSLEHMHDELIKRHNEVVSKDDIVIVAGDFSFAGAEKTYKKIVSKLNGNLIFLRGCHDNWLNKKHHEILCKTVGGYRITVCHWCMRTWPVSHYNGWHLYGHCLDLDTEILTINGWKKRNKISKGDIVITYNIPTNSLEYDSIKEIIDYHNYCGEMYSFKSKGIDLRVTANHVMLDMKRSSNKVIKVLAHELNHIKKRVFIKAGVINNNEYPLNDDMIRLLVWIAADGSLSNSSLCRIRLTKRRKIHRIRQLLTKLKINFREYIQRDSSISFNFTIPDDVLKLSFKPISKEILKFNRHQTSVMIDEYTYTDGSKYGNTSVIYTSKKEEADLIQQACITQGYTCNISSRTGGFSNRLGYVLCITDAMTRLHHTSNIEIENVYNEHVWCIKTNNQTIFIRRNGKPIITGNSHGRLPPIGKSWDIGVDTNNFYPYSFEDIKRIMDNRPDNPNYIPPERRH